MKIGRTIMISIFCTTPIHLGSRMQFLDTETIVLAITKGQIN